MAQASGEPNTLAKAGIIDATVRDKIGEVLDETLPEETYDKDLFIQKRDQVFDWTLDLAINHQLGLLNITGIV